MNCWKILGIEPTIDLKLIQAAYAELVKQHHPEDDPEGFKQLHEAYKQAKNYVKWQSAANERQPLLIIDNDEMWEPQSETPIEKEQPDTAEDENYQFDKADTFADPSLYDQALKVPHGFPNFKAPKPRGPKRVGFCAAFLVFPGFCLGLFIIMGMVSAIFGTFQNSNSKPNFPTPNYQPQGRYAFLTSEVYDLIRSNMPFYESTTTAIRDDRAARSAVKKDVQKGAEYNANAEVLGLSPESYHALLEDYERRGIIQAIEAKLNAYTPNETACLQTVKHRIVYLLESQAEYEKAPESLLLGMTREEYDGFLSASKRLLTDANRTPTPDSFDDTPYPGADQDILNMLKPYSSLVESGVADIQFLIGVVKAQR